MENYFQKSASRHHCHCLWSLADSTGEISRLAVVYHARSPSPSWDKDCAEAVEHALREHKQISSLWAVYVPDIDLQHYGEVDHLAPAGAMEDFVHHVQGENLRKARQVFASLQSLLADRHVSMDVGVVASLHKAEHALRRMNARPCPSWRNRE